MSEATAFSISIWSGGLTVGGFATGMLLLAAINNLRAKAQAPLGPLEASFGAAVLGGVPVVIASGVGLVASVLLIAIGTPPVAYLFVGAASCLSLTFSLNRPGGGMEGCTKLFGTIWSAYAIVWSGVSFWMLGGPDWLGHGAASLRWLQPLLVALPYAALLLRMTSRKDRSLGKFAAAFVFLSALFALIFLPVEAGFAGRWLPASDWLRFPLAALVAALVAAAVPTLLALGLSPRQRRSRLRELPRQASLFAALLVPASLAWAAARAITGAVA